VNARTLEQVGEATLEAIFRDIHADRNSAYAKLGVDMATRTHAYISDTACEIASASARDRDEKPESEAGYSSASDMSHMSPLPRK
jgi:hypothetical protein